MWLIALSAAAGCATAENKAQNVEGEADAGAIADPADARPIGPDSDPADPADASVPPPDATVATADAAPPAAPDACVPSSVNLLSNPSFDEGPGGGWAESSSAGYEIVLEQGGAPVSAHSGSHLVWLGGYLQESGVSGVDWLSQDFTVPAGATGLEIAGYRILGTEETGGAWDTVTVTLRNTSGAVLETLSDPGASCSGCTWSNAHAANPFAAFTLTPSGDYAGQTVRLHIESSVDGIYNTNFFFDTLAARVTTCP